MKFDMPNGNTTKPVAARLFGEDPVAPQPLSKDEAALVERFAAKIVRWGLVVPAILMLEVHRPLSFMASQGLHMLSPFYSMFFDAKELSVLAKMLERRDAVEAVIVAIEDAAAREQDKQPGTKDALTAKVSR